MQCSLSACQGAGLERVIEVSLDQDIKSKEGREKDDMASYKKDDLCEKAALPRHAPSVILAEGLD
jgi:hypothetical protein